MLGQERGSGVQLGFDNVPRSVDAEAFRRQHAGVTYLQSTAGRSNITVLGNAHATKVNFAEGADDHNLVATSVDFVVGGATYTVYAKKDVILAAGQHLN